MQFIHKIVKMRSTTMTLYVKIYFLKFQTPWFRNNVIMGTYVQKRRLCESIIGTTDLEQKVQITTFHFIL